MIKEDIFRLTDINKNLEREIVNQRKHNLSLVEENTNINNQNINLNNKINNANKKINYIKSNSSKYTKFNLIRDKVFYKDKQLKQEYDYKKLIENKNKLEIDMNLLKEKYEILKDKNDKISKELDLLKKVQENKLNDLDNKIADALKKINELKDENISIKMENTKLNEQFLEIMKEKEKYYKLYKEQKIQIMI